MEDWQQNLIDDEESRFLADMARKRGELARFFSSKIPVVTATEEAVWCDASYWSTHCPHCDIHCTQMKLPVLHKCAVCEKWYFVKEEE